MACHLPSDADCSTRSRLPRTILDSQSGRYIALLIDRAHAVMPSEVHDVLHPYLGPLDQSHADQSSQPREQLDQLDELVPVEELFHALERGMPPPERR